MLFGIENKVAVVTGASSGLGADAARAYAEHGADVAILARRKERLDQLAGEIQEKTGRKVLPLQCDVSVETQVKQAVEAIIQKFGKIDILLNNAGQSAKGSVVTYEESDWDRIMNVNLKSVYLMCKHVAPHMIQQNYGKIVNIASLNAIKTEINQAIVRQVYNASKAGVKGLTMSMAPTFAPHNITVNSIGPGLFETEMTAPMFASDAFMKWYNDSHPMHRPANPGELNGAILFFSSDASSYVTGQYLPVDGGFSVV